MDDDSTVFQLADSKMCVTTPVCIDSCPYDIHEASTQSECNKLKEKNRCTCKIIKLGFLPTNDGYFLSFFSGLGSMNIRTYVCMQMQSQKQQIQSNSKEFIASELNFQHFQL